MEFNIAHIVSIFIFSVTFFFILTERMHRTVVAFVGAVSMVVAGVFFGFYDPELAIESIDFNTIGLLFGMMILVALLEETGVFQFLGIYVAKKTKGNPWLLFVSLGTLTTVLSMVLDNVTTIVLIAPVSIIIARLLGISPVPVLMGEALLSDIGGVGTLVGDPPNIMIGSAAGFSFNTFLLYALPVVIVVLLLVIILFRYIFKEEFAKKSEHIDRLMAMDPYDAIEDKRMLQKLLIVFFGVIVMFFMHNMLHLEPSTVALLGAAAALLAVRRNEDPHAIIQKTELSVLLFFVSLFVIVGGLEHTGILSMLGSSIVTSAEGNILLTALIVLWVSAIMSAIVDNIPFTVAMIPIISFLSTQGVDADLLWWALAFGVGFGGNATPIGSTANVIIVSKSEETETPITFKTWFKSGTSSAIVALLVATVALVVYHQFSLV